MNVKSLMIGNLFHEQYTGQIIEVIGLNADGSVVFSGKFPDKWKAQRIPLTEDWLLKFGAIKLIDLSDGYKRFNVDGIQLNINTLERDFFVEYVHQIPMKHVHTFQNYYFAIKQKELTLKP